ncbi:MAG: transposase, partial [Cytophagaceae bacterium]|nr:transposase [Cytophagaceae bacterium]
EVVYFCTFTCYNWLPLFELTDFYNEVYKWFDILKSTKIEIIGYVLMPNHVHLLIYYPGVKGNINTVIGTGKRFMAYEIIRRLNAKKEYSLLKILSDGVDENE